MKTFEFGVSPRLRVLCFGEGVSLAHVGRPLELARALDPARYEIHFASSERYRGMVEAHGFAFHAVDGLLPQEFMARLAAGAPLYDEDTLRRSAEADLRIMRALRPDLVIGDFRVYFERHELGVLVHRILSRNTLKDFLYRSGLKVEEDEALQQNPKFWEMIEAARTTK